MSTNETAVLRIQTYARTHARTHAGWLLRVTHIFKSILTVKHTWTDFCQ